MGDANRIDSLRRLVSLLIDPAVPHAEHSFAVDAARPPAFSQLTDELREFFARSAADAVEVRAGDVRLGVVTRHSLAKLDGAAAGPEPPFSSGDHASLTGESSRYRAIRYRCREAGCEGEAFRVFHDARYLPTCPKCHTVLELPEWI